MDPATQGAAASASSRPEESELAASLLRWYRSDRRDLPWRRTRDAWAIWVSEVMLQQTRVEAVRDAYERFVAAFPDPASFARAGDDALLTAWQGLGYYRRARLLRDAARRVVAEHGGRVPEDPDAFGALPGVGSYTKGAVQSIAFDRALPAVDGNVERVLARLLLLEGDPRRRPAAARIRRFIAALHAAGSPGELNQALMELGATVCVPQRPSCSLCPLHAACLARSAGRAHELPRRPARARPVDVTTQVCVIRRNGRILARRVPAGEINQGQICLPGLGLPVPVANDLAVHLRLAYGLAGNVGRKVATIRHGITRYRIRVEAFEFAPAPLTVGGLLGYRDPDDPSVPWTTVARKVFDRMDRPRA